LFDEQSNFELGQQMASRSEQDWKSEWRRKKRERKTTTNNQSIKKKQSEKTKFLLAKR
jgi:hypothetical protein